MPEMTASVPLQDLLTGVDVVALRGDPTIEINDLKHLEKVITSLRAVEGVLDVERTAR